MGALDVVVAIPIAGVGLHKADSFFDKAAGEEALPAEGIGIFVTDAVGFQGRFLFTLEVEDFGNLHLHAVGKFVGGHAGAEFAAIRVGFEVALIEFGQEIEVLALPLTRDSGRGIEVEDGAAFGAERGALKVGGEEAIGPIGSAALWVGRAREDHESGQVFVFGAESVGDPGTDAGVAAEAVAGVELVAGGRMVDRVDVCSAVEANFIDLLFKMNPFGGNIGTALSGLFKFERAFDKVTLAGGHRTFSVATTFEFLKVSFGEFGLGVEGVNVGRASFHH